MAVGDKLRGNRVLVVEDEFLIACLVEDILADTGCVLVGPVPRVNDALPVAREETIEVALLDMNLASESSLPIAAVLQERGIPVVFMTGYTVEKLPDIHAGCSMVAKPFRSDSLIAALERAIG
jgi:DNA-binding response OmpR family regulator